MLVGEIDFGPSFMLSEHGANELFRHLQLVNRTR